MKNPADREQAMAAVTILAKAVLGGTTVSPALFFVKNMTAATSGDTIEVRVTESEAAKRNYNMSDVVYLVNNFVTAVASVYSEKSPTFDMGTLQYDYLTKPLSAIEQFANVNPAVVNTITDSKGTLVVITWTPGKSSSRTWAVPLAFSQLRRPLRSALRSTSKAAQANMPSPVASPPPPPPVPSPVVPSLHPSASQWSSGPPATRNSRRSTQPPAVDGTSATAALTTTAPPAFTCAC
jgi:hypothetical protein